MERLSNLFFELSHEDRLVILHTLREKPLKLTMIASKMNISSQEAYRHIQRLVDSGLVAKTPEGDYKITAYGHQINKLIPGFNVLTNHQDYFKTRDLTLIPEKFLLRIGELNNASLLNDVMVTIFDLEVMIREAEEYVCIMLDQMVMNLYKPMIEATEKGVEIRVMRPQGWRLADEIAEKIGKEVLEKTISQIRSGKIVQREPDIVPVFLAFSEKEVAALSFAKLDGSLDYLGFKSGSEEVHNWCLGLFETLWDSALPGEVRTRVD